MRRNRVKENKEVDRVTDSLSSEPRLEGHKMCPPECKLGPEKRTVLQTSPSGNTHFVKVIERFVDGKPVLAEGAYFVLPNGHYLPDEDMPFDFLREVNWHIRERGLVFDNGGFNYTKPGGARILDHAHYWLMQVQPGDPDVGLHTLRQDYRSLATTNTGLEEEVAQLRTAVTAKERELVALRRDTGRQLTGN